MVAIAFALRLWLLPLTGTGAMFVLFFAAVLAANLVGGVGPGIVAVVLSLPLAAYVFAARAGYPLFQASFQSLLFSVDGLVVVYLTHAIGKSRRALEAVNDRLRRANDELASSGAHARDLIELAPDAFFLADLGGRFTMVNRAAADMLGYAPEELVGKTIVDIIPEQDVPRLWETRSQLEVGGTSTAEWTHLHKDGSPIPIEISSRILADGRWMAFARDLRERKRQELALRESEERFRLALDQAPIGMALIALDGRFVRVNQALSNIVGYSPAELMGMTFQDITHPDDVEKDLSLARALARGDIPGYRLEKRYVHKDGRSVDIMLSRSVLRGRDGTPLYYVTQMEDITERKRADEALRRSEEQYRGLIEQMPDGVFAYRGGRIVYANDAFAKLLGYDAPSALVGKPMGRLLHPDDRPTVAQRIRALRAGRSVSPRELRMHARDGSFRNVETVGRRTEFEGRPSLVVIVRDLTERRRAEQALRVSEAKFSGIVAISADAIISIDEDQRMTSFNEGAKRIFGYPMDEAIGAPLEKLIPERFRSAHRKHVERFAASEDSTRGMGERVPEIVGLRKNGEEFPAEASISKLMLGDQMLLTVALRDVTERKLLDKEQQFLADAGPVLSSSLDDERTIAALAEMVVRGLADWCIVDVLEQDGQLGRRKVACADPAQAPLCARLEQLPLDRARPYLLREPTETRQPLLIERIRPEQLEAVAQSPEHLQALRAVAPVSVMVVPLLLRDQLLGTLAFVSSTPSRVFRDRDLRFAEVLAGRAALAIENARLYRASVQAARLRDQVLGVVAHDLRTPLSAILLQADAMKRGAGPERRAQRPSEGIRRAALRMNRLIDDLLDVARLEERKLTVEPTRLSAGELVVETAELHRALVASESVELRVALEADGAEILGDRHRLLQVLENLVGNAIKFTQAGGCIT
ncbi:MAG TPA: PAS domain S-box protein, partial [Polyangiaceae bacterium]|nr:PAS domain S-box protein [Polyangiaceae bacterium]